MQSFAAFLAEQRQPGEQTALYRHFDSDGKLLYAGITRDIQRRTREHRDRSIFGRDIASTEVEFFRLPLDAAEAERHVIVSEGPIWNLSDGGERWPRYRPETELIVAVRLSSLEFEQLKRLAGSGSYQDAIRQLIRNADD